MLQAPCCPICRALRRQICEQYLQSDRPTHSLNVDAVTSHLNVNLPVKGTQLFLPLGSNQQFYIPPSVLPVQGETFMERRMQWALHRLHTLEERMVQIETAGGAYTGESFG